MIGWQFSTFIPRPSGSTFEKLLRFFQELLLYTSGDVAEALAWLTELDKTYKLSTPQYGIGDFIQELKDRGLISDDERGSAEPRMTPKMEMALRKKSLEDIFDTIKKSGRGRHPTKFTGLGDELLSEIRPFQFGDRVDQIAPSESISNAQINHGLDDFTLTESDLQIHESFFQSQTSTVLMIDISHSMILYGEDRITPAKKVALGLAEMIKTQYIKDTLDIIVFGDDAWEVELEDIPYLQVGPYHTNTVAGIELAMAILRRRKNPNKQIFMITDGKPTCIKIGKKYYKNAFGIDRKILSRTLALAVKCRKLRIPITTFMIAQDPYLVRFVDQFTMANQGKAFYSSLDGLGEFIFMDYKNNKRKRR